MTTILGIELIPCPWCGCIEIRMEFNGNVYYGVCENTDCNATGPWDRGESGAAEKWNERALIP